MHGKDIWSYERVLCHSWWNHLIRKNHRRAWRQCSQIANPGGTRISCQIQPREMCVWTQKHTVLLTHNIGKWHPPRSRKGQCTKRNEAPIHRRVTPNSTMNDELSCTVYPQPHSGLSGSINMTQPLQTSKKPSAVPLHRLIQQQGTFRYKFMLRSFGHGATLIQ